LSKFIDEQKKKVFILLIFSYIDDPSRFQIHQARAEEITLKEDFISVPMPVDDDFGNTKKRRSRNILQFFFCSGDANGLDEPEFFRKLQPSLHFNAQNSNMDLDSTKEKK
jgi:hypothetical protein